MKLSVSCIFLLFVTMYTKGQSSPDYNTIEVYGPEGSVTVDNIDNYMLDVVIHTNSTADISITVNYNTSYETAYIVGFNEQVNHSVAATYTGVGTGTYIAQGSTGEALLFLALDDYADPEMYFQATIAWKCIERFNEFPTNNQVKIQSAQTGNNLLLFDSNNKSMGLLYNYTSDYSKAVLSIENSNMEKLGITPNKLSSNTSLGITSSQSLYFTSNGASFFKAIAYNFATANYTQLLSLSVNGIGVGAGNGNNGIFEITKSAGNWIALKGTSSGNYWALKNPNTVADQLIFEFKDVGTNISKPVMSLYKDGKMTIGTVTTPDPSALLSVGGSIVANEVKVKVLASSVLSVDGQISADQIVVKTNGQTADFVFEDGYDLKDLAEIEKYIKEHKHLPNIPSAQEMEANGVDLAEMNKLLLQKVEELTMYIVEQNNAMEQQGTEIKQLNSVVVKQNNDIQLITDQLAKLFSVIGADTK